MDPGLDLLMENDLTFDGERPYLDLDSTPEQLLYLKNYKTFMNDIPERLSYLNNYKNYNSMRDFPN